MAQGQINIELETPRDSDVASSGFDQMCFIDLLAINREKIVLMGHHETCLGLKTSVHSALTS